LRLRSPSRRAAREGRSIRKDPLTALQPWNHNRAGIEKLPNGVEYYVVRKGDGKEAAPGEKDMVEVEYEGRLAENGLVFDSSYQRGDTAKFRLNQVIPGWTTGMPEMQPGDMFVFWIPSKEGYGASGQGMQIPPNADLMFQVELLKVIADPWAKAMPWPTDAADIVRLPSGLEYFPIESGADASKSPTDGDEVVVNFEGRLEGVKAEEGETADDVRRRSVVASTFEEGQPKFFPVKDLVPGWSGSAQADAQGRPLDGAHAVPAAVSGGRRWPHPPDATVLYELELLDFQPAAPAGQPQPGAPIPN